MIAITEVDLNRRPINLKDQVGVCVGAGIGTGGLGAKLNNEKNESEYIHIHKSDFDKLPDNVKKILQKISS